MPISVTVLGEPVRGTSLEIVNSISSTFAAANVGAGYGVYKDINSGVIELKSLIGSTGIILTNNTNDITIAADSAYITSLVNVGPVGYTLNKAVITNGTTGGLTTSPTSATQIGYLSNVTSDVQGQLNAKQDTITGAITTVTSVNLSNNIVAVTNGSGKLASSAVTTTELGYLTGVTSYIQTQLNTLTTNVAGKISGNPTTANIAVGTAYNINFNSGAWYADLNGITSTGTTYINLAGGNIITGTGKMTAGGGFSCGAGTTLKFKILDIGAWNMDSTTSVTVVHGLDFTTIRSVDVILFSDIGGREYGFFSDGVLASVTVEGAFSLTASYVVLYRRVGGVFDANTDFDSAVINRGKILIWYEV